jgi:hypothetical protein
MAAVTAAVTGRSFKNMGSTMDLKKSKFRTPLGGLSAVSLECPEFADAWGWNFALHARNSYDEIEACHRSNKDNAQSCFVKIGHLLESWALTLLACIPEI